MTNANNHYRYLTREKRNFYFSSFYNRDLSELVYPFLFSVDKYFLYGLYKEYSKKDETEIEDFFSMVTKIGKALQKYQKHIHNKEEITPLQKAKICLIFANVATLAWYNRIGEDDVDGYFTFVEECEKEFHSSYRKKIMLQSPLVVESSKDE